MARPNRPATTKAASTSAKPSPAKVAGAAKAPARPAKGSSTAKGSAAPRTSGKAAAPAKAAAKAAVKAGPKASGPARAAAGTASGKAPAKVTPAAKAAKTAKVAPAAKAEAATEKASRTTAARKAPAEARPDPAKTAPAKAPVTAPAVKKSPTRAPGGRPGGGPPARARSAPLDAKFLEEQRALLVLERATYVGQAEILRAEAEALAQDMEPGDIQFDDEGGEGGTTNIDRERDLALSAQARAEVEEIDAALARIDAGTYGICERCGEPIPRARLKALPQARLGVDCKSGGLSRR